MPDELIFTIFTPTYNRAHTIQRVYNSLISQTFKNFEWLIVDDGSTDTTHELVKNWQNDAPFPIRYYYQENSGMLLSVRMGVQLANGELFLKADSDDSFKPETLKVFYESWLCIPSRARHEFAGVTCLVENEQGEIIGDIFPEDNFDSTRADISYRHKIRGEKWGFHRVDVMAEYPVPEEIGQHFAMGLIINAIGKKYKTRFINSSLRIYHQDAGEQVSKRSPQKGAGRWITYAFGVDDDIEYLQVAPFAFLKIAILGSRLGFHAKQTPHQQINHLKSKRAKFVWLFGMPFGGALFFLDKIRY